MSSNSTGPFLIAFGMVLCSCSENSNPLVKLNKAIEEETQKRENQEKLKEDPVVFSNRKSVAVPKSTFTSTKSETTASLRHATPKLPSAQIFLEKYAESLAAGNFDLYLAQNSSFQSEVRSIKSNFPQSLWSPKIEASRKKALEALLEQRKDPASVSRFEYIFSDPESKPSLRIVELRSADQNPLSQQIAFAEVTFSNPPKSRIVYMSKQLGARRVKKMTLRVSMRYAQQWRIQDCDVVEGASEPFPIPDLTASELKTALEDHYMSYRRPFISIKKEQYHVGFPNPLGNGGEIAATNLKDFLQSAGFILTTSESYRDRWLLSFPESWKSFAEDDKVAAMRGMVGLSQPGIRFYLADTPRVEILEQKQNGKVLGIVFTVKWDRNARGMKMYQKLSLYKRKAGDPLIDFTSRNSIIKAGGFLHWLAPEGVPCVAFAQLVWNPQIYLWDFHAPGSSNSTRSVNLENSEDREFKFQYPNPNERVWFVAVDGRRTPYFEWDNGEATYLNNMGRKIDTMRSSGFSALDFKGSPSRKISFKYKLR